MTRANRFSGVIAVAVTLLMAGSFASIARADGAGADVSNATPPTAAGGAQGTASTMSPAGATAGADATATGADASATGTGLKNTGGEPVLVSMIGIIALGSGLVMRRKLA